LALEFSVNLFLLLNTAIWLKEAHSVYEGLGHTYHLVWISVNPFSLKSSRLKKAVMFLANLEDRCELAKARLLLLSSNGRLKCLQIARQERFCLFVCLFEDCIGFIVLLPLV